MTLRVVCVAVAAAAALVAVELLVWILWPDGGGALFFATLVGLEWLERAGLPTLKGSSSGWPVPTGLGWIIALIARLVLYVSGGVGLAALWKRRLHRHKRPNQAMQLTASKPAVYAWSICRRERMLRGMRIGRAAAELLPR